MNEPTTPPPATAKAPEPAPEPAPQNLHGDRPEPISLAGLSPGDAVSRLYRLHAFDLRRLARALVPSSEVDDLVSEVFAAVLQALRNGSGPTDDRRGYLIVTMRRAAIVVRRRLDRYPTTPLIEERTVVDRYVTQDGDVAVIQALHSLPPRQQAVLWATAVEGYGPRDLAPSLHIDRQATAALAYRARVSLRTALAEQPTG